MLLKFLILWHQWRYILYIKIDLKLNLLEFSVIHANILHIFYLIHMKSSSSRSNQLVSLLQLYYAHNIVAQNSVLVGYSLMNDIHIIWLWGRLKQKVIFYIVMISLYWVTRYMTGVRWYEYSTGSGYNYKPNSLCEISQTAWWLCNSLSIQH